MADLFNRAPPTLLREAFSYATIKARWLFVHQYPPLSISRYSFLKLRELDWEWNEQVYIWFEMAANYSKLCSLDCIRYSTHCTLVKVKMTGDLLFRWICELILSPPVIALLDARVGPQWLDRLHVRLLERRYRLVVYVLYKLRVLLKVQENMASWAIYK